MVKKTLIVFLLLFVTLGFSESQYDKDITVLNQSRNDNVALVFKEMMRTYEEKDINGFFSYVSEDKFVQDYMTFYDAIDKDMRVYDIFNVDTWINKTIKDGIKRYLYVRWEKRYQSTSSNNELSKIGYSRFLFDEVNGKYKLIGLAGNNFWGGSLAEWRDEVPDIAGQETKSMPDLVIINATFSSFTVKNIGNADVNVPIKWVVSCGSAILGSININLTIGSSTIVNYGASTCQYQQTLTITVDPDNTIEESDETNNKKTISQSQSLG